MSWRLTPAGEEALCGKLSAPQRRALEDVRDHYDPAYRCVGRSMFGGLTAVMLVLNRNKWIEEAADDDYEEVARGHVNDLVSGRLPPEDVASNIAEDMRRAREGGR